MWDRSLRASLAARSGPFKGGVAGWRKCVRDSVVEREPGPDGGDRRVGQAPQGEVVKTVWDYIKKHELQNPENRREILADDKLEPTFGKKKVTMFEMNKHLAQHLK